MNNLEEWENAKRIVKEAWEDWKPHFEILESANGEKILAFFLLNDTDIEWRLYHDAPEEISEDFADYMEDAKEELLKHIGFNTEIEEEKMNNETAIELTEELEKCMRVYERKTGMDLSGVTFNMLFYSEWLALPEEILERRYEEEMKQEI